MPFFSGFSKKFFKNFFTTSSNEKIHPIQSRIRWIKLCLLFSKTQIKSPYITFCGDIRANFNYLKIAHFTEHISEEIPQKPCIYASFRFLVLIADSSLCGGEAGDGDTERAAGDIVQT